MPEPSASFASITSAVVSVLGAPHVPVDELAGNGARAAFLGFPVRRRDPSMSTLRRDGVEETVAGVLDRVWDGVDGVL
ncbi:MAG TPA: hypothetical protein VGW14_00030 [Thermoleophilaceae bacterium]|nr:hypothetical protein [Thermoleophilaceae bacterium]